MGGTKHMRSKPSRTKPKAAKKELSFDVGQSLTNKLCEYAQLQDSCPCCFATEDHEWTGCLVPATHPIHHDAKSSYSDDSLRASSHSSRTLVETQSNSNPVLHPAPPLDSSPELPVLEPPTQPREQRGATTFEDMETLEVVQQLAARYGRVSHMGILDRNYGFFVNQARTAALTYKAQNQVAIVSGDPLCEPCMFNEILAEFNRFRKAFRLGLAFMGTSDTFVKYASQWHWTAMEFGIERVINPMENEVLMERAGKRIISQNKQLLCPDKGGITLQVYIPAYKQDLVLEKEIKTIYDAWRQRRNETATTPQAFITVFDLFDFPNLMTYIYTRGPDGVMNGFAALRRMGADQGYHIDPCIAALDAPKGISDLMMYAAMALLNQAGVSYLSLGYEPLSALGNVTGVKPSLERIPRSIYSHSVRQLPVGGKKAYHDKFKPDPNQDSGLYMVFPSRLPGPRQMVAMAHMANISIRNLIYTNTKLQYARGPVRSSRDSRGHENGGSI